MNIVSHNMFAMDVGRQLNITNKNKTKSVEKLSSGFCINKAADDAAGLSISEKMRSQIRGLNKGIENVENGVSLCQVADGALAEVSDMLHRITELSVQSANGTNTTEDRDAIQKEINQILQEIDRIGETTEFNKKKIFNGTTKSISLNIPQETKKESILIRQGILASFTGQGMPTDKSLTEYKIDADISSGFVINGTSIELSQIKDLYGNSFTSDMITAGTYQFSYNNIQFSFNIVQDCSKEMALEAVDSLCYPYEVEKQRYMPVVIQGGGLLNSIKSCEDSFFDSVNHSFSATETGLSLDGNPEVSWSSIGLNINDLSAYSGMTYTFKDAASNYSLSFKVGDGATKNEFLSAWNKTKFSYDIMMPHTTTYIRSDYKVGNTTLLGYSNFYYTKALYQTMNYPLASSLGYQLHFSGSDLDSFSVIMTADNGSSQVLFPDESTLDLIRNNQGGTFSFSDNTGSNLKLHVFNKNDNSQDFLDDLLNMSKNLIERASFYQYKASQSIGTVLRETIKYGEISFKEPLSDKSEVISIDSYEGMKLWIQSGCNVGDGIFLKIDQMNTSILGIQGLNVSTIDGAYRAMEAVEEALEKVSANRSKIGAQQNRLEHIVSNEENIVENTTYAESRIRDTDMAIEMVEYSKNNILEQFGQSMLAQANQMSQNVLSLLQ